MFSEIGGELMSKHEIKQLVIMTVIAIINVCIAYAITIPQNIVLFKSYTAMQYTITYEVIIVFSLSLLESLVYEFRYKLFE